MNFQVIWYNANKCTYFTEQHQWRFPKNDYLCILRRQCRQHCGHLQPLQEEACIHSDSPRDLCNQHLSGAPYCRCSRLKLNPIWYLAPYQVVYRRREHLHLTIHVHRWRTSWRCRIFVLVQSNYFHQLTEQTHHLVLVKEKRIGWRHMMMVVIMVKSFFFLFLKIFAGHVFFCWAIETQELKLTLVGAQK